MLLQPFVCDVYSSNYESYCNIASECITLSGNKVIAVLTDYPKIKILMVIKAFREGL